MGSNEIQSGRWKSRVMMEEEEAIEAYPQSTRRKSRLAGGATAERAPRTASSRRSADVMTMVRQVGPADRTSALHVLGPSVLEPLQVGGTVVTRTNMKPNHTMRTSTVGPNVGSAAAGGLPDISGSYRGWPTEAIPWAPSSRGSSRPGTGMSNATSHTGSAMSRLSDVSSRRSTTSRASSVNTARMGELAQQLEEERRQRELMEEELNILREMLQLAMNGRQNGKLPPRD